MAQRIKQTIKVTRRKGFKAFASKKNGRRKA